MKFMVTVTIKNISNDDLKLTLEKIITNDDLNIENILNTVNQKENYNQLLIALEDLSKGSNTFKKLYERVKRIRNA